jgi:hypothetical protein
MEVCKSVVKRDKLKPILTKIEMAVMKSMREGSKPAP